MIEVGKTWSFNGIDMVVEKDSQDYSNVRMAVQDVLDASDTYAYYGGTTSYRRELRSVLYSNYENLMALIGSGYYSLISDQGAEGTYYMTECRSERLQALNKPEAVYRVTLQLLKKGPPSIYTSREAYVATFLGTALGGVYYSSDFVVEDDSDPTWTAVNNGLPSNAVYALLLDCEKPEDYQYVQLGWDEGQGEDFFDELWRRKEGGAWTKIFDWAMLNDLVDSIYNVQVRGYFENREVGGRIHCLAQDGGSNDFVYLLTSDDYGDNWDYINAGDKGFEINSPMAYGDRIAFNRCNSGGGWVAKYTLDGGDSWNVSDDIAIKEGWNHPLAISRGDSYYYFGAQEGLTGPFRTAISTPSVTSWLYVNDHYPVAWPSDMYWFHPTIGGTVRYIREGSYGSRHSIMYETDDHFASAATESEFTGIYNICKQMGVDDSIPNFVLYGADWAGSSDENYWPTPHVVLVADANGNIVDAKGKAGANCADSPYTDSIPNLDYNGLSRYGIRVIIP